MPKYTAVYTAHEEHGSPIFDAFSSVEYIEGETLDAAIEKHVESLKARNIGDIVGEVILLEGHVRQVEEETDDENY